MVGNRGAWRMGRRRGKPQWRQHGRLVMKGIPRPPRKPGKGSSANGGADG
jgi:hypothetical protein